MLIKGQLYESRHAPPLSRGRFLFERRIDQLAHMFRRLGFSREDGVHRRHGEQRQEH